MTLWRFGLYSLAAIYILAGLNHFRIPDFYLHIMPPYLPAPQFLVLLSGAVEVLLGALVLVESFRRWAAWGIVLMLLVFLSVHIYMIQAHDSTFADLPIWALWLRIPAQGLLIWWAVIYTRPRR